MQDLLQHTQTTVQVNQPFIGLGRPYGFQEVKLPKFQDNWHIKRLRSCQPYELAAFTAQEIFLVLISVRDRIDPRTARIISMKNLNDTNGNGTRDLSACSAVCHCMPQNYSRHIYYVECEMAR
jgi:hypothetical protein